MMIPSETKYENISYIDISNNILKNFKINEINEINEKYENIDNILENIDNILKNIKILIKNEKYPAGCIET